MKSIELPNKNVQNPLRPNFCHGQNCPTKISLIGQNCPTERKTQKFNRAELPHKKNGFNTNKDKGLRGFLIGIPCNQVSGAEMPMLYIFTMGYNKFKKELNFMKTSNWRAYMRGIASAPGSVHTSSAGGGSTQTSSNGGGGTHTSTYADLGTTDVIVSKAIAIGNTEAPMKVTIQPNGHHNHGIEEGTRLQKADGGDVGFVGSGLHIHSAWEEDHYHDGRVQNNYHNHSVSIPEHTHSTNIPNHTHNVAIPAHTHEFEFGIFEGTVASKVTVKVDGNEVPVTDGEIDITKYFTTDEKGKILRGAWHKIELTPDKMTRVIANLYTQIFTVSRGGGGLLMTLVAAIAIDGYALIIGDRRRTNMLTGVYYDDASKLNRVNDYLVIGTSGDPALAENIKDKLIPQFPKQGRIELMVEMLKVQMSVLCQVLPPEQREVTFLLAGLNKENKMCVGHMSHFENFEPRLNEPGDLGYTLHASYADYNFVNWLDQKLKESKDHLNPDSIRRIAKKLVKHVAARDKYVSPEYTILPVKREVANQHTPQGGTI